MRYELGIDLAKSVIECNCSHCQIQGALLSFVPNESMKVLKGEATLTEYRFNTEKIQHLFCKTCGVESFGKGSNAEGQATYAINVRTIDNIDLSTLERMPYDGKSR